MKTRKPETSPNTPEVKEQTIEDFKKALVIKLPYEKPIRRGHLRMFVSEPIIKKEEEKSKCLIM